MRFKWKFGGELLIIFAVATGCGKGRGPETLHVELSNATTFEVTEAKAMFGKRRCSAGVLIPGAAKTHVCFNGPITPEARVTWVDASGNTVEKIVNVARVYNLTDSGVLYLQIETNDVKVTFSPRAVK